ncbi:MAG: hypothetical protein AAF085_10475 [Planctomycetota bacterium]
MISIIALLIAILLPAIGAARSAGTRFLFDRHPGITTNASFVDGHNESVTAKGLYELEWGPRYDTEVGAATAQAIDW